MVDLTRPPQVDPIPFRQIVGRLRQQRLNPIPQRQNVARPRPEADILGHFFPGVRMPETAKTIRLISYVTLTLYLYCKMRTALRTNGFVMHTAMMGFALATDAHFESYVAFFGLCFYSTLCLINPFIVGAIAGIPQIISLVDILATLKLRWENLKNSLAEQAPVTLAQKAFKKLPGPTTFTIASSVMAWSILYYETITPSSTSSGLTFISCFSSIAFSAFTHSFAANTMNGLCVLAQIAGSINNNLTLFIGGSLAQVAAIATTMELSMRPSR